MTESDHHVNQQLDSNLTQIDHIMDSKASQTRVHLPDYFAICATGHESVQKEKQGEVKKLSMIDQASRFLTLEFSMQ